MGSLIMEWALLRLTVSHSSGLCVLGQGGTARAKGRVLWSTVTRQRWSPGCTVLHAGPTRPESTLVRRTKTLLAWSSGKDSAFALWALGQRPDLEVVGLLTTLNSSVGRVSMHGVQELVLDAQAEACGLPLKKVWLPDPCSDEVYRAAMAEAMDEARSSRVEAMAFGDLFLPDVRSYREEQLAPTGIRPLFPLWGRATTMLAHEMIDAGLCAIVTCVDTDQLDAGFVGRSFDSQFLEDLPASVDPCGENGEFHTVALAGPMFRDRLPVQVGEVVDRQRFVFADVALLSTQGLTRLT